MQLALRYKAVKTAVRPLGGLTHQTMLDGVVVDVVHMALKILFAPNLVFPETALPDPLFAFRHLARAACRAGWEMAGEVELEQAPAH